MRITFNKKNTISVLPSINYVLVTISYFTQLKKFPFQLHYEMIIAKPLIGNTYSLKFSDLKTYLASYVYCPLGHIFQI
jgi:hypothetical protein